jgi:hypothetical protein
LHLIRAKLQNCNRLTLTFLSFPPPDTLTH